MDLQRHEPHAVAADLGLSIRQFHRSRRAAHDRFFVLYRTATHPLSTIEVDEDFTRRLLTGAARLIDSCEVSSASAILNDVANSGADAAVRCEALVLLAEANAWAHRLDRARVHVNAAEAILAAATTSDAQRAVLLDASEAVSLLLLWFAQGPSAISRVAMRRNGGSRQTAGRAALVRAAAALRSGDAVQATLLLQGFNGKATPPEGTVDLLALRAEIADFTAENPLLSEELFTRAADAARIHGLRGRELYATHQLWLTRWAHSRSPQDRSTYRGLVDEIDRSLSPRLRSYLTFSAADVELAIGNPERAHAAAVAAGSVSTNGYESFSAHGLAAGALLRLGRTAEAGVQARLAAEAARTEGHARVVSLAQRISAQAYLAQGDRRAARGAIEEAIECARQFSTPHVLAQTQRVLARIIGR
ncbi:MAG: hypothetical protein WBP75_12830 [Candidatus Cybelea sp.]